MKRPFLNPDRRFNFAALCAEKCGGRNVLDDFDAEIPESEDQRFAFHMDGMNGLLEEPVFGGDAWLFGNRRFAENGEAVRYGSEIWIPEDGIAGHILVQHPEESALLGAVRMIALNAMLSGRDVKFIHCGGRDEFLIGLSDAMRKAIPSASCVFFEDTLESCFSNLILNTENQLLVMPAQKLIEKEREYNADLFGCAKKKNNVLLLCSNDADIPARVLQGCAVKLAERPELIPEAGRIEIGIVNPGLWVDIDARAREEAGADFWKLFEEPCDGGSRLGRAESLVKAAMRFIPEPVGNNGNSVFQDRARRFLAAWIPPAFMISGPDRECFRAQFGTRAVDDMLANDDLARRVGWRRMAELYAVASEMGWKPGRLPDEPENQRFLDQFGYASGYIAGLFRE